MLKFGVFTV